MNELVGGVLHTTGNAVLATPSILEPVLGTGGVVTPLVQTIGQTVRDTGQTLAQSGVGAAVNGAANLNIGGQSVVGSSSAQTAPVAVAVLAPNAAQGDLLGASVLSGGQTAALSLGSPATGPTQMASNGAANGLLGGQVGGGSLTETSAPLIGLNLASNGQTAGTLATIGVAAGGQPVNLAVGDTLGALTGGAVTTQAVLAPVVTAVAPVTQGLTDTVGGLTGALTTASTAPATNGLATSLAPVTDTVTGVVGGLVGGLTGGATSTGGKTGLAGLLGQ